MQNVEKEGLVFPGIPEFDLDKSLEVSLWTPHMERNYGGKRVHEGTDMVAENKRGCIRW